MADGTNGRFGVNLNLDAFFPKRRGAEFFEQALSGETAVLTAEQTAMPPGASHTENLRRKRQSNLTGQQGKSQQRDQDHSRRTKTE